VTGPLTWLVGTLADPRIDEHLLTSEGEQVIDEVRHHPVVYVAPLAEFVVLFAVLIATAFVPLDLAFLPIGLAVLLGVHLGYQALKEHMDRFVVTNMRVFRISGVFTRKVATMPISRILDISVDQPFMGRMLGFGHLTFESAAQEQGLRDIRYVGHPSERDLTIQRVIQRAGLRATVTNTDDGSGDGIPDLVQQPRKRSDHPRLHPVQGGHRGSTHR
jgi:membrane protein YdbS with pleckstrin-like domain